MHSEKADITSKDRHNLFVVLRKTAANDRGFRQFKIKVK
jgi:hypothetical protein